MSDSARQKPPSALSPHIDEIYSSMDRFLEQFRGIDDRWSRDRLLELAEHAEALLDVEKIAFEQLTSDQRSRDAEGHASLEPLVRMAHSWRQRVLAELIPLSVRLRRKAARAAAPPQPEPDVQAPAMRVQEAADLVARLVRADDELAASDSAVELLTSYREELLQTLREAVTRPEHPLRSKLWHGVPPHGLADLSILLLADRRSEVLGLLSGDEKIGPRFGALGSLLSQADVLRTESVLAALEGSLGYQPDDSDIELVWRCLLVGHQSLATRRAAAGALPVPSLWRVLAYPDLPVAASVAVGLRVYGDLSEEARRIFFDIARSGLMKAVSCRLDGWTETQDLLSLLFEEPFFVEKAYFERLEGLYRAFRAAAQAAGLQDELESLRGGMQRLARTRLRRGDPEATLPRGVSRLPAPVQRHLAREEEVYVGHFILHPDFRIAGETRHHIGLGNINRLLLYRAINDDLFQALLKRKELFAKSSTVLMAVNHPRCTAAFASEYLRWLKIPELRKLTKNAFANREVVSLARERLKSAGEPTGAVTRRA